MSSGLFFQILLFNFLIFPVFVLFFVCLFFFFSFDLFFSPFFLCFCCFSLCFSFFLLLLFYLVSFFSLFSFECFFSFLFCLCFCSFSLIVFFRFVLLCFFFFLFSCFFFLFWFLFFSFKNARVLDIADGQRRKHARRIYPKKSRLRRPHTFEPSSVPSFACTPLVAFLLAFPLATGGTDTDADLPLQLSSLTSTNTDLTSDPTSHKLRTCSATFSKNSLLQTLHCCIISCAGSGYPWTRRHVIGPWWRIPFYLSLSLCKWLRWLSCRLEVFTDFSTVAAPAAAAPLSADFFVMSSSFSSVTSEDSLRSLVSRTGLHPFCEIAKDLHE